MGQNLITDLFITTKGRSELLAKSLKSLAECTARHYYRFTLVVDTGQDPGLDSHLAIQALDAANLRPDHLIVHRENLGLGPSINQALAHIDSLKKWDGAEAPPFTCYLQDDLLYTPGWLERLSKMFLLMERQHKLGFASGIECVEHKVKKDLGGGMILKDWIRAANIFGRHDYWMSMYPISRIDPETGRERAKPNDGMGSGVDWWFIRNHPNSVCKTGRTNLVIPGLLQHMGYDKSTWLQRELPESDADKTKIAAPTHELVKST